MSIVSSMNFLYIDIYIYLYIDRQIQGKFYEIHLQVFSLGLSEKLKNWKIECTSALSNE